MSRNPAASELDPTPAPRRFATSTALSPPPNMISCPALPRRSPKALPRLPAPMIPILILATCDQAGR
jgi:hypothetical protein